MNQPPVYNSTHSLVYGPALTHVGSLVWDQAYKQASPLVIYEIMTLISDQATEDFEKDPK